MRSLSVIALATLLPLGCGAGGTEPANAMRVLFIGNSLTYTNNLPGMVQVLAQAAAGQPLVTSSVTVGGYSLEDHWADGAALRAIRQGGWDVVVLQQGPSALPESRALLQEAAAEANAAFTSGR